MNDDTIQNQIAEITGTSPAATQVEAQKPIESVPTYSTLRTGTADTIQEAPAQQYENTTVGGVKFTPDTDEVMMAGTGIKGLGYDTRFKTPEDAGDPLYFEPNFLPVEPYPVGNIESTTLNDRKLGYELAKSMGAYDRDYIGYYRLPEPGSLSWWSHFNGAAMQWIESSPSMFVKMGTGVGTTALKAAPAILNATWQAVAEQMAEKSPESAAGSFFKVVFDNYKENIDALNNMQKIVNDAVSPLERRAFDMWNADFKDTTSFKARSAQGVVSGFGSFGLAGITKMPNLMFTLLNFSEVADMRNKALNFGVSPLWAEAYSIGTAGLNSWLDTLQFDALVNSSNLLQYGTLEYLQNLGKKGLWQGIKKHALREVGVGGAEAAVEMFQTNLEEFYNPEYRKDPTESLAIAAISAFALKAVTLPASVRHANLEEQEALAEKYGVGDLFRSLRASGYILADDMISKGALQPSQRDAFVQSLISEAPDFVVRTLREGVQGEMDKISPEARKEMASLLQTIIKNRGATVFSPETMQKLDTQTADALSGIRQGISDSDVTMIQGLVRGAYVVANIAHANDKNWTFTVPKFVVATNKDGISFYSPKTNTIGIHGTRSNTANTNMSANYASQVVSGFRRSTEASDQMASILHEMSHWLDHVVGQNGFGDFLENYYNDIARVFGKEKAQELRDASNDGVNRVSTKKEKGKSTEQHAQAVARLGKRAAESFGLGKSATNQFLSYANIVLNQLSNLEGKGGEKLSNSIDAYQEALRSAINQNMQHLSDLIEVYGSDTIKEALSKFNDEESGYDDFAQYLADKNMLKELYDVMDNFSDAAGLQKISDLFNGNRVAMDNFVTAGDKMFRNGYDSAVEEVRQRRQDAKNKAENKAKPVEAKADKDAVVTGDGVVMSKTNDKIDASDMPTFFDEEGTEHEEGSAGQMQDWAKAALGAKESVKQSFESAKETKQIPADKQIDGRNLTDDINMASNGLSQRVAQPMNKFVKWASSSKWGWGLDRILVTILGRDAAEKFDVAGKYSAKQAARTRYWDEFQKRLESLFGTKDKTKFMFKYKTMVTDLGFVRMNNVEMINPANTALSFKRNITGWEAMYVYLMDRQGYGARVQKSTTTNIKDIIALLSPEEKSFADAMSDQLMDMYKRTFKEGSKYENYFPIQSAEHELYNELSIDSLTARQKTDDAIAIIDAGRVFSQYVSRWASHESGYFETLKRLRDVFGYRGVSANEAGPGYIFNADEEESRIKASAQVAATVRQVLGNDGYDNLMNNINSEIQDKQELLFDKSRQNVLTQLGNNIMKSILANKVISFPKNAVNMMMMFGGAKDQSLYWNSFAEGWAKPKETYDYMMAHSNEIKQRWGTAGGINEYLDQRTLGGNTAPAMKAVSKAFANMKWDGDRTNNMAKFSAVMDMLGDAGLKLFMQSGDMIANVYGGYDFPIAEEISKTELSIPMYYGMTEEEAFKKLDRYIIEHQSSSNLAMKPLIQKEHMGDFLGQVFAFTSEGVAKWASIMGTFDEVNMGTATRSEAITNAASIAISMALYSILAAGAWDLLSDDEKVQEDTQKALVNTVIDQVFGGMVAGNALISPMISYMIGDTRLSGMSTPFYNYAIDAGTALKKGNYFEAWLKAQSALGLPVGADNAWNTMLGISLLTDPNPQVREAGKLMMMGYTKNRSAKRAGTDKETIENSGEE